MSEGEPAAPAGKGAIDWRHALLVMLACHGTSTLLLRLVPTIGPQLIEQYGWGESFIGWMATAATFGSLLVVAGGTGILRAIGSMRAIQAGLVAGCAGTLLLASPWVAVALLASLLVGLGHGPTNPAGNDVLRRYAPSGSQALVFSIKQSAVPLGGVVGGLVLPVLAQAFGVRAALVFGAAVALATLALTLPLQRQHSGEVSGGALARSFSAENLLGPLRTVGGAPVLRALATTGFLLALLQSVWFVYLTSFLVLELGYAPTTAGLLYALMQGMSIFGRILLGWVADRIGGGMPLIAGSLVASALATLALAGAVWTGPGAYVVLVVVVGGLAAAAWNGVLVAETVRVAGADRHYETISGVTLAIGCGVVAGPLIVSVLIDLGASWAAILSGVSLLPLLGLPAALRRP